MALGMRQHKNDFFFPRKVVSHTACRLGGENVDRETLLSYKKTKNQEKKLTFISTYSHVSNDISNLIRREWHILGDTLHTVPEFKKSTPDSF